MIVLALATTLSAACDPLPREATSHEPAVAAERALVRTSDLQAGGVRPLATRNPYEGDQRALAEGERLYLAMNCAGCHGPKGGGAIGPPFLDADWIYGDDPAVLHASIAQGRPNGMPAFGGKLSDAQIWQLALHVRAIGHEGAKQRGAQSPTDAARRAGPAGAGGE